MTIGENIKKIRIGRGLTQKELGDLVGISDANVRHYESGHRIPKINRLEEIALALDVNVEEMRTCDLDEDSAVQRLIQIFKQYNGSFDEQGNLHFNNPNIHAWYKRWNIYQDELKQAEQIADEQERLYAIEDAEDKFDWWMITYDSQNKEKVSKKAITKRRKKEKQEDLYSVRNQMIDEIKEEAKQADCPIYHGDKEVDLYVPLSKVLEIMERHR